MKISPTYDKDEIPWEVIAASLQGELTAGEMQPLSLSPVAQERYVLWLWLWREMLSDYELYARMNPEAGLRLIKARL